MLGWHASNPLLLPVITPKQTNAQQPDCCTAFTCASGNSMEHRKCHLCLALARLQPSVCSWSRLPQLFPLQGSCCRTCTSSQWCNSLLPPAHAKAGLLPLCCPSGACAVPGLAARQARITQQVRPYSALSHENPSLHMWATAGSFPSNTDNADESRSPPKRGSGLMLFFLGLQTQLHYLLTCIRQKLILFSLLDWRGRDAGEPPAPEVAVLHWPEKMTSWDHFQCFPWWHWFCHWHPT